MKFISLISIFVLLVSCNKKHENKEIKTGKVVNSYLTILGTIQDAGSPHIGCKKTCCNNLSNNQKNLRKIVSLALMDNETKQIFLIEATPDISNQLNKNKKFFNKNNQLKIDGIFLTHAHIGHYSGLMYLGKEAINSKKIQVFALPRMKGFLEQNGPWSQLIKLQNIYIKQIFFDSAISISKNLKITAIKVPHRDEYSETAGFIIEGKNKKALFIPDIDKWEKWNRNIIEIIKNVDYAFVDGTFYSEKEIKNRNISEIPHPLISESMKLFADLPPKEKNKIYFIHFNHTNPVLDVSSKEYKTVIKNGFNISQINSKFEL